MKSKCETIIHESLQSMKFSRKRHRITKSDVKNSNKALKQSKERRLAQENKSKYSEKIREHVKKFGDDIKNNEKSDDKLQKTVT
jgi:hypothetical protein